MCMDIEQARLKHRRILVPAFIKATPSSSGGLALRHSPCLGACSISFCTSAVSGSCIFLVELGFQPGILCQPEKHQYEESTSKRSKQLSRYLHAAFCIFVGSVSFCIYLESTRKAPGNNPGPPSVSLQAVRNCRDHFGRFVMK